MDIAAIVYGVAEECLDVAKIGARNFGGTWSAGGNNWLIVMVSG